MSRWRFGEGNYSTAILMRLVFREWEEGENRAEQRGTAR